MPKLTKEKNSPLPQIYDLTIDVLGLNQSTSI